MTSLVLTVIAPDQPGLIEQLSQTIVDHEGNWLESSISRLAGQFAGILIVAVADKQADSLTDALKQLESQGLTVLVERSSQPPLANIISKSRYPSSAQITRALSAKSLRR